MDESNVIRKWTRSGSKYSEDELSETKRIKNCSFYGRLRCIYLCEFKY